MIATALGANTVAVVITAEKLEFARSMGAVATIDASAVEDVAAGIVDISGGGAHVSIDALGHPTTSFNSVSCLRKRGKHVQVGLMAPEHRHAAVPMDRIIAGELEILGSHGMQAERYGDMLEMIRAGKLHPEKLIGKTISLEEATHELVQMDRFAGIGVSVIDSFYR
jgi:alcohol dehydrogenase